jgi:hypothetical protein
MFDWSLALPQGRDRPALKMKAERAIADTPEAEVQLILHVKEIVNLWAGKFRGSEVNAGQVLK